MPNRILASIAAMDKQIAGRIRQGLTTKAKVDETSKALDLDVMEHAKFQEVKTLAFAQGILNQEEAQTVYALLGQTPSKFNRQSVAAKAVLTGLFKELLQAQMATR